MGHTLFGGEAGSHPPLSMSHEKISSGASLGHATAASLTPWPSWVAHQLGSRLSGLPCMHCSLSLYTEEEDSLMEHIESLLQAALEDFAEEDNDTKDQAAWDAAAMAHAYITEGTHTGHMR